MIGRLFPDLFRCLTLISPSGLANPHLGKDNSAIYKTEEGEILDAFGQKGWLLSLANTSEMFSPYLNSSDEINFGGVNIVAGDTPADRLVYWNGHHRFPRPRFSEITSLRPSHRHVLRMSIF